MDCWLTHSFACSWQCNNHPCLKLWELTFKRSTPTPKKPLYTFKSYRRRSFTQPSSHEVNYKSCNTGFFYPYSYDQNVWIGIEVANSAPFVFSSDSSSATYFDWQSGTPTVGPGDESRWLTFTSYIKVFTKHKQAIQGTLRDIYVIV